MSRKYKFWDSNKMYFISFATVNWIDVFTRNEYRNTLIESWKFCQQNKGLEIYGWCIMPSHVHMIVSSHGNKLGDIIRDMKSFTSTKFREAIINHPQESRKEWMKWMFERAGKKNASNNDWSRTLSGATEQYATGNYGKGAIFRNVTLYTHEPCCSWLCKCPRKLDL